MKTRKEIVKELVNYIETSIDEEIFDFEVSLDKLVNENSHEPIILFNEINTLNANSSDIDHPISI